MKFNRIFLISAAFAALSLSSCLSSDDETIALGAASRTDIPSDSQATPNPSIVDATTSMPNIQYSTVDENGTAVFRIDMTGIQDRNTLEWLRLAGTGEKDQNVWAEIDGEPKGIKVYNTADDEDNKHSVPVDLVFLVDNSGSMSEEANAIARDIADWASRLNAGSLDIRFGCVGYDGAITGAIGITTAENLTAYLNRAGVSGTNRTVGFEGSEKEKAKYQSAAAAYRTGGGSSNECGMAALRFATDQFSFRRGANRIFVNFTDEPNQPAGISKFSVESLLTDWDTSLGTIHTVFSDGKEYSTEFNAKMSEYTGGTVIYTNSSFSGVTLESLPVTDAMQNSYIIRMTNIEKYMDNRVHDLHITVLSPDGGVAVERNYNVMFTRETPEEK